MVESCSNYFRYPSDRDFCNPFQFTTDKICEKLGSAFTIQRTFSLRKLSLAQPTADIFLLNYGVLLRKIFQKLKMAFIVFRISAGKNQRCLENSFRKFLPLPVRTFAGEKSTVWKTLFTDSEFQRGEIQPFSNIFLRSLITGLGKVRFGWFLKKIILLFSSTAQRSKLPNFGEIFLGIKNAPSIFWKTRAQDFCGIRL